MPTITVRRERLLKLIGVRLSDEELSDLLFNIKVEAAPLEGDLWELEVTPDRLDMLISEGIARVARGVLGLEKGPPSYRVEDSGYTLRVDPSVLKVRPYIAAAIVYGYKMDNYAFEEVIQMQEKLHQTIGRDRRKVAIGLHNLDAVPSRKLAYAAPPLEGVRFRPLDELREMTGIEIVETLDKGVKYGHLVKPHGLAPLFQTEDGTVLSMPPIINSELTRVAEDTKNILIDVTGPDLQAVEATINILTYCLAENAESIGRVKVFYPDGSTRAYPREDMDSLEVTADYISRSIGLELTVGEVADHLKRMRFKVETVEGGRLKVYVPPYRYDVLHPVDLVEDVAISVGYNAMEPRVPKIYSVGRESLKTSRIRLVRDIMVGLGFQEIVTFMLASSERMEAALEWGIKPVKLLNPISPLYDCLRSWLTPNLLEFLRVNQHSDHPIKVFEVGDVVVLNPKLPERSETRTKLAAAILYSRAGYKDVQAALYALMRELSLNFRLEETTLPFLVEGRTAEVLVEGVPVGFIGEVHPRVLVENGLEFPVALFEVDLTSYIL